MNPVKVRNVEIGTGMPKICVPIVGRTKDAVLKAAAGIKETKAHVAEWRADWYEDIFDSGKMQETLRELRDVLGEMPLLFTFRTQREGGEKEADTEDYVKLNQNVVKTGLIDLVDAEFFTGDQAVKTIIAAAREKGVKTVVSSHDFHKTPDREEIVGRLRKMQDMGADILKVAEMQELGADIPKIAVMPRNRRDVLTLLEATEEMASVYADRPIITMSMSGIGSISRLCGEVFGSALTFGSAGQTSAPGQMEVEDLAEGLELIHRGIGAFPLHGRG